MGGVKQSLSNYNPLKSICEYIWKPVYESEKVEQAYERTRITGTISGNKFSIILFINHGHGPGGHADGDSDLILTVDSHIKRS